MPNPIDEYADPREVANRVAYALKQVDLSALDDDGPDANDIQDHSKD